MKEVAMKTQIEERAKVKDRLVKLAETQPTFLSTYGNKTDRLLHPEDGFVIFSWNEDTELVLMKYYPSLNHPLYGHPWRMYKDRARGLWDGMMAVGWTRPNR
jgi:hypothetical protein